MWSGGRGSSAQLPGTHFSHEELVELWAPVRRSTCSTNRRSQVASCLARIVHSVLARREALAHSISLCRWIRSSGFYFVGTSSAEFGLWIVCLRVNFLQLVDNLLVRPYLSDHVPIGLPTFAQWITCSGIFVNAYAQCEPPCVGGQTQSFVLRDAGCLTNGAARHVSGQAHRLYFGSSALLGVEAEGG